MGELINGRLIAKKIRQQTAAGVAELKELDTTPKLAVVLVGEHKPSLTYVRKKEKAAGKVGMDFELYNFSSSISKEKLLARLEKIQSDEKLNGLIIQLPLPEHLYAPDILNKIKPDLDVDCLTDVNLGKLVTKTNSIVPPTPGAVISILHELEVDLVGKNVTIVGAGALVGKPLAIMMMNEKSSVTVCDSSTRDIKEKCLKADIVVSGVGKKDLINGEMIKEGAIVIDTGVSFVNGKLYGDVNMEEVTDKASYITPTPGGTGPITVARLLKNTLILTKQKKVI